MSTTPTPTLRTPYAGDREFEELTTPELFYELFLAWGISGSYAPNGWFKLKLAEQERWFSINCVQGLCEEFHQQVRRRHATRNTCIASQQDKNTSPPKEVEP